MAVQIEKLRNILGHSTVQVTERYAHLAPDAFSRETTEQVSVDLEDQSNPRSDGARTREREQRAVNVPRLAVRRRGESVAS